MSGPAPDVGDDDRSSVDVFTAPVQMRQKTEKKDDGTCGKKTWKEGLGLQKVHGELTILLTKNFFCLTGSSLCWAFCQLWEPDDGLPSELTFGYDTLSSILNGFRIDDIKVHINCPLPAEMAYSRSSILCCFHGSFDDSKGPPGASLLKQTRCSVLEEFGPHACDWGGVERGGLRNIRRKVWNSGHEQFSTAVSMVFRLMYRSWL